MKQNELKPDEAIDRVLNGLREIEPIGGMHQRVLHAARARGVAQRPWGLRLPSAATSSWAIPVTGVAVIALTASWIAMHHTNRTAYEVAHAPAHLPSTSAPRTETHLASAQNAPSQPPHGPKSVSTARSSAPAERISDEDALAISEMLAPSKPAPPLPLTHQEKLLAEVVHHGAPEELASLIPDVRAREIEIAKADFHNFFEPPASTPPIRATE